MMSESSLTAINSHSRSGFALVYGFVGGGSGPYLQHFIFFVIYEWAQKACVFVPSRLFHPSLIFVGKVRCSPYSRASERCFTWIGSSFTHKYQTRLEKLTWIKHSILIGLFVTYKVNKGFWRWLLGSNLGFLYLYRLVNGLNLVVSADSDPNRGPIFLKLRDNKIESKKTIRCLNLTIFPCFY